MLARMDEEFQRLGRPRFDLAPRRLARGIAAVTLTTTEPGEPKLPVGDADSIVSSGVGTLAVRLGSTTGRDGIGGVSVLASAGFSDEETDAQKRPSVQVGDPFMEKLLIECTLEVLAEGLVVGIQDLGGAGLSCATSELASAGEGGMHVVLDDVPLRDSSLAPEEILMSESQERMMAVVTPDNIDRVLEICRKWDVDATVVGEVNDSGRLTIEWRGEQVVDVRRILHSQMAKFLKHKRSCCNCFYVTLTLEQSIASFRAYFIAKPDPRQTSPLQPLN